MLKANFDLRMINPCIDSHVSPITLTPDDDTLEARVNEVANVTGVSRTYEDPTIIRSQGFPSGIDKCGTTTHYIADYDPDAAAGSEYTNLRLWDASYSVRNSLYFRQVVESPPVTP